MRKKSQVILQWILVIILVIVLTCCGNLLLSVTVLTKLELQDPTLVSIQMKYLTTLKYLENGREKSKLDSESQLNYVPKNGRKLGKDRAINQALKGTSKPEKSHKAGSPNKVGIVRDAAGNIVQEEPRVSSDESNAPRGFSEEYIRYFWKHPELIKRFNETRDALKSRENEEVASESENDETKAEPKKITYQYITIDCAQGKLGNQMFQLASLIGIAVMRNLIPILPWNEFKFQKVFKSNFQIYSNIEHKHFAKFTDENKTVATAVAESKQLDSRTNWTLNGYFQSFEYFTRARAEIKDLFEIKDVYVNAAQRFIQDNVPAKHVKVAIHIRRQDFISSFQTKLGRVAATADYVKNAQDYFLKKFTNITFLVVSDDQPWCHQNIHGDNVVFSNGKSIATDLAIMSESDHVIMSVGTFGWWGAWLSGGIVIYYKHYPRPGSYLDSVFNPKFYYPRNWIAME